MGCSGSRHLPPSAPHPATIATSSKKFDPYKSSSTYSSRDFKVDEALRDCIVEELCVDISEPSSSNVKVSSDDSSLPKCQLVHHCKISCKLLADRGHEQPLTERNLISLLSLLHRFKLQLQVTKLTLECTRSGGAGLGSYIKHAVGLEEINVIMENLTPQTAAELLDGCCSSKSMRRLHVFDKGIDSHVAAKLSRVLTSARGPGLSKLALGGCPIEDIGGEHIGQALCINRSLISLSLSSCCIGDSGAQAIARGLNGNYVLRELVLSHGNIGPCGTTSLADAIAKPGYCKLQVLCLNANSNLGDSGAEALAEALHHSTEINRLELNNCGIGNRGTEFIARGVEVSMSLQRNMLTIRGNPFTAEAASKLRAAFLSRDKHFSLQGYEWHDGLICRPGFVSPHRP